MPIPQFLRVPSIDFDDSGFAPPEAVATVLGVRQQNGFAALAMVPFTPGALTNLSLDDNTDGVAPITTARYLGVVTRPNLYDDASNSWGRQRGLDDDTDSQAPIGQPGLIAAIARLQGYDAAANQWDRLRSLPDNADAQAALTQGLLAAIARGEAFNGATWDRLRTLSAANLAAQSGIGGLVVAGPGQWAIQHSPAADTQATITRAAVAATRHVCTGIQAYLTGTGAANGIAVNLRDGASGAGTILWSGRIFNDAALPRTAVELTGLNIPGSVNTAMTLEFAAAPAGGAIGSVALQGYDAT